MYKYIKDIARSNVFTVVARVCVEENNMYIAGIVFDTSSRILFWVDVLREVIGKMHVPVNNVPGTPIVLHNLTGNSPRDIALDVCNRCVSVRHLRLSESYRGGSSSSFSCLYPFERD